MWYLRSNYCALVSILSEWPCHTLREVAGVKRWWAQRRCELNTHIWRARSQSLEAREIQDGEIKWKQEQYRREIDKTECLEMTAIEGWKRGRRHDWKCERSGRSGMRLAVLPLAGSGKIPWLRLLMTEDLGESSLLWPEVFGECWVPCPPWGLGECWRPCPEWERRWCSPSLCSFRGSQRGTLSSWAVLDRSIST